MMVSIGRRRIQLRVHILPAAKLSAMIFLIPALPRLKSTSCVGRSRITIVFRKAPSTNSIVNSVRVMTQSKTFC